MITEMTSSNNHSAVADWSPGQTMRPNGRRPRTLNAFLRAQREKLLELREALGNSVAAVARGSRERAPEGSPLGQHPADAGSDSYDRDFALGLLSHDQDALLEIEEALSRIEHGTYGICEVSGKPIPRTRLEAIPFARLTVAQQAQLEREEKAKRWRRTTQSVFAAEENGGDKKQAEADEGERD
ncbi:MAG TPA: TraR/DksA C4-type zinc finger protein [Chthoniobacterales bacterium]|jgi:RNA polymerase-binding transcription factor DksA